MGDDAISVQGLGKRYRLGEDFGRYLTLRDAITSRLGPRVRRRARASDDLWALRDVSFTVEEGESVGVIGRNGAGKSTLLKILARITEPTTGVARMRGRVGALLEVGTGFHPELTGRENVYLNGSILGMSRREITARFDDIVEFAALERFLDTPLKRYSTGMELRLAFAIAAHVEPPILVVDEVLAVGDAEFQQRCLGKMSELGSGGRTVIFVSHDLGAVRNLCPRTIWLEEGTVRADAPSTDVIERYLRSGLVGEMRATFDGPEEGTVRLHSVSITSPQGEPLEMVTRRQPFSVTIRFTTRERLPDLDLAVALTNRQGVLVLDEGWSDTGRRSPAGDAPGEYEARLTLAPMLSPGEYRVGIWMGSPGMEGDTYLHRDVLVLRIWPEPGDRQDSSERQTVLSPDVKWDMSLAGLSAPTSHR